MHMTPHRTPLTVATSAAASVGLASGKPANPFVGRWALIIPGGKAGWLGVTEADGQLQASLLWGGGSVVPVQAVEMDGDSLKLTRVHKHNDEVTTETITARVDRDKLTLATVKHQEGKPEFGNAEFTGLRIPPLPPAPDLAQVRFGDPIRLFNGRDLDGWELLNPNAANGWSVCDGVLTNDPAQEEGQPRKHYGNLRTTSEFEDFRITMDVSVPPKGNSGVYLRGIYEIQVLESFGRPVDSHNMGAVYSRITPTVAVEKPANEWQTLAITLVDRHVTVVLNGTTIIDNQPLLGCTGGALWADEFRPGPIYLQGDHTGVSYRNIILYPVLT